MHPIDNTCPHCGAPVCLDPGAAEYQCEYCGSRFLPEKRSVQVPADTLPHPASAVDSWAETAMARDKAVWQRILWGWIVLIVACMIVNQEEIGASLLLFGLLYIIPGKPRKKYYRNLPPAQRSVRMRQLSRWRIYLGIYSGIQIIQWSLPQVSDDYRAGCFVLGMILLFILRPQIKK